MADPLFAATPAAAPTAAPLFAGSNTLAASPSLGATPLFAGQGGGDGGYSLADKLGGSVQSFIEAFPEMLGVQPTETTKAFRAANPVSGFLSQAAGFLVPAVGELKALSLIPKVAQGLDAVEALGAARGAFLGGAARGAAEGAILGATTTAASASGLSQALADALPGDHQADTVGDTLPGLALNVVGGGVLGGLGKVASDWLARGPKIGDLVPNAAPDRPINVRLDALDERLSPDHATPLTDTARASLERERSVLQDAILRDVRPEYSDLGQARIYGSDIKTNSSIGTIVNKLEGDTDASTASRYVNSLFDQSENAPGAVMQRRVLAVDPQTGFSSPDELSAVFDQLGTSPEELARNATSVRLVSVEGAKAPTPQLELNLQGGDEGGARLLTGEPASPARQASAEATQAKLDSTFSNPDVFTQVGNEWKLSREADGGQFVMARQLADGSYVVARTHNPDFFDPQGAKFRDAVITDNRFFWPGERDFTAAIGEPTYDLANSRMKELGPLLRGVMADGKAATQSAVRAMVREASERLGTFVAPTGGLASMNPRYAFVYRVLKDMEYDTTARVDSAIEGSRVVDRTKGPLQGVVAIEDPHSGGGFRDLVKGATADDLRDIHTAYDTQTKWEDMQALHARGLVSDKTMAVLGWMHEKFNVEFPARLDTLAKNLKADPATQKLLDGWGPLSGHYGITRSRPGGFKVLLEDVDTGELRGLVGGTTAGEARREAAELIKTQADRGMRLRDAGFYDETAADGGNWKRLQTAIMKPGFLRSRGELLGYEQAKVPTEFDLSSMVRNNLRRREELIANIVAQEKLGPALAMLETESKVLAQSAQSLMRRSQGDEGAFAEFQNKAVDKITLGLFGKDSASKITQFGNRMFTSLQYMGSVGQAALNAAGLVTTLLPEIAYVASTGAKQYILHDLVPAIDATGRMRGTVGVISPTKIMGESLRLVFGRDTPEEFAQLLQELGARGQLAARYSEDQFGTEGRIIKAGPKEAGYLKWANAVVNLPITKAEEFNRVMTAGAGYLLGKEMQLEGADLARFALQFNEKVNFAYNTTDKPLIFTTPVGSVLGTLKTWTFNYMANMLRYATGGPEALPALLWQTGTTFALAGTAGSPFYQMANGASKFFTNKDIMANFYDWMANVPGGEHVADGLMYGLPASVGLSMSSSAASPGADPTRDAAMFYSSALWGRMSALTNGTKDAWAHYAATGESPFASKEVRDELAHAFAPRTAFRALSVAQDESIKSLSSGNRIMSDVTPGEALLYTLGFAPTDLEKTYAVYSQIRGDQAKKKALVQGLGKAMADAMDRGDADEMNRLYSRTTALGLDVSSVLSSAQSRQKAQTTDEITRSATPEQQGDIANYFNRGPGT